ncbi:MAG: glutamate--tRNA ligase [Chloroflexi bacterium]|nr:glutamate--tRNA ligase [Chloroflexota bacterium]
MPVRVRFAPSPTGFLHIGGARTALFNWLFARKHNGAFILRIEDTDQSRYVAEAEDDFKDGLRWLGMQWDEGPEVGGPHGPYRQSERTELYQKWVNWLIENDSAYRCNMTGDELAALREQQKKLGLKPGYDRRNRDKKLGPDIGPHVVRFKMPLDGQTVVHDEIRGDIVFENADLPDLVLLKSDGLPTYHLANVVDDHAMQISHILRADEWIPTAPLHAQLYRAFGWEMPKIAHLPVILSPTGKGKLSKRDQAFQEGGKQVLVQVREFRRAGYLPEAVVNFLTNVGWASGDDSEVFSPQAAMARFELKDINPAGSKLPYDKLEWLNGVYIREKLSETELADRLVPVLEEAGLTVDRTVLEKVVPLITERMKTLNDAIEKVAFLFGDTVTVNPEDLIQKKMDEESTVKALEAALQALSALETFDHETQEAAMRDLVDELGIKTGQLFGTLRVAVTGQRVSPPLFETMEIIGQETVLERIQAAIAMLQPA